MRDLNQFAMTETENRLVITAGNFAVGDVLISTNTPRTPGRIS